MTSVIAPALIDLASPQHRALRSRLISPHAITLELLESLVRSAGAEVSSHL